MRPGHRACSVANSAEWQRVILVPMRAEAVQLFRPPLLLLPWQPRVCVVFSLCVARVSLRVWLCDSLCVVVFVLVGCVFDVVCPVRWIAVVVRWKKTVHLIDCSF